MRRFLDFVPIMENFTLIQSLQPRISNHHSFLWLKEYTGLSSDVLLKDDAKRSFGSGEGALEARNCNVIISLSLTIIRRSNLCHN